MRLDDLIWLKELLNIETGPFWRLLRLPTRDEIQDAGCEHRPMTGEKGVEGVRERDLKLFLHPAKILIGNRRGRFWAWRRKPPNKAVVDFLSRHRTHTERSGSGAPGDGLRNNREAKTGVASSQGFANGALMIFYSVGQGS
jgi:hypothetical protein